MRAGIAGYLGKDISPAEFKTALHKIRFGRRYISENIVRDLARVAYGDLSDNPFQQLSVREMQIMLMVLGCKSPSAIAQVLHLSAKTVNSYRYRLFEKLGVNSDVELAIMAIQHEVVALGAQTGDRPGSTGTSSDRKEPLATGTAIDLSGVTTGEVRRVTRWIGANSSYSTSNKSANTHGSGVAKLQRWSLPSAYEERLSPAKNARGSASIKTQLNSFIPTITVLRWDLGVSLGPDC